MTASEILKKQCRFSVIFKAENNEEVKVFTLAEIPLVHCWRIFAYIERQSDLQLHMQIQKDICPRRKKKK